MAEVLKRPARLFGEFFHWWTAELAGLVPKRIREPLSGGAQMLVLDVKEREVIVIHVTGDKQSEIGRVDISSDDTVTQRTRIGLLIKQHQAKKKIEIALRLPSDRVLRKPLTLPTVADSELRQALHFQIDRETPFKPDQVSFDFRVTRRRPEENRIEVELVVVPRTVVEEAMNRAAQWGVQPTIVDIADPDGAGGGGSGLNLLEQETATTTVSISRSNVVLAAILSLLVATSIYVALDQRQAEAEFLSARVTVAKSEAGEVADMRDQVERLSKEHGFLVQRKNSSVSVLRILDELTRRLPDNTWVYEFRFNGDKVNVAGYSATASKLIGLIDESPLLRSPKFQSPVTLDARSGLERFNLSCEIERGDEA